MRIESGPTGERKVRTTLLFLMVAVFAAWFAYDGIWGYPSKNRVELIEQLPLEQRERARNSPVYARVTVENAERLRQAMQSAGEWKSPVLESGTLAEKKEYIASRLGGPPSFETEDGFYYFGPALGLKFAQIGGSQIELSAMRTQKSEVDILAQKGLAAFLAVLALYLAIFVIRVRTTHAVLDDAGLTYNGKGPIAWVSMKELDSSRFARKGWVDLIYDDHGTQKRRRLDEYHLARFNEMLTALCEKKGFENPLEKEKQTQENATT